MSNGAECCAILVCCDAAARRQKLSPMMAAFTDVPEGECGDFLDRMDKSGLTFAPMSFADVMAIRQSDVPALHKHQYAYQIAGWMAHEDLVFAPKAFDAVVRHIVSVTRKHALDHS